MLSAGGLRWRVVCRCLPLRQERVQLVPPQGLCVVASAPAASATRPLFANGNANWYIGQTGGSGVNGRLISNWQDAGAVTRNLSTSTVTEPFNGVPHVYCWRHATSGANVTVDHFLDPDLVATTTRTDGMAATNFSTWYLGAFSAASLFGAWTVRALALFPFALATPQIVAIIAYWNWKYRI